MKFGIGCEGCRVSFDIDDRNKVIRVAALAIALAAAVAAWFGLS